MTAQDTAWTGLPTPMGLVVVRNSPAEVAAARATVCDRATIARRCVVVTFDLCPFTGGCEYGGCTTESGRLVEHEAAPGGAPTPTGSLTTRTKKESRMADPQGTREHTRPHGFLAGA